MLLRVIYTDKKVGVVKADRLEKFLLEGQILAFRRLDGWVRVGLDPVRGHGGKYCGSERRNVGWK